MASLEENSNAHTSLHGKRTVEVGILIGLNCPSALRPRDVIHGNEDESYAVKSLLGWHINGPVNQSTRDAVSIL